MTDLATELLGAVKSYLNMTWQDAATDEKITGYINRGMARLQKIAGAPLDFTKEEQPRALLLDYCRYANSQALEVFEQNFMADLLDLNLSTQAPVIEGLTILLGALSGGTIPVTVVPDSDSGNSYLHKVGTDLSVPGRLDICTPGSVWTAWDGVGGITAAGGQEIAIVEINGSCEAVRAGKATV